MSDHLTVWQSLIDSDDRTGALTRHLAFLTDSPESDRQLSALLTRLVDARIDKDFLEQLSQAGLTVDDVVSPSDYGQNWLIWHPVEKNQRGEPAVYFVSHGDCVATEVTQARDLAFGPLRLAMMAQEILGLEILDEVYN